MEIPARFWEDQDWVLDNYSDLMKKYPDSWVAVFKKKVISVADNAEDARKQAKPLSEKPAVIFIEGELRIY